MGLSLSVDFFSVRVPPLLFGLAIQKSCWYVLVELSVKPLLNFKWMVNCSLHCCYALYCRPGRCMRCRQAMCPERQLWGQRGDGLSSCVRALFGTWTFWIPVWVRRRNALGGCSVLLHFAMDPCRKAGYFTCCAPVACCCCVLGHVSCQE